MPTMRERVIEMARAGERELNISRLFIAFCGFARMNYMYSATKVRGAEGATLLDRDAAAIVTVDCAGLADALVILINDNFNDQARRVELREEDGFATGPRSRCFDINVEGNVRAPNGTFGQTGRCVFNSHYFVETGADTRRFLDPCMFTAYSHPADAMPWTFETGVIRQTQIIKFVQEDKRWILVRTPPDVAPPAGFNSGFILFKSADFAPEHLAAMLGKRPSMAKNGWSEETFKRHDTAALDRINALLRKQAGINTPWALQ